ncbi:MAG TPA: universal stress protein [Bacteroidales bacterium]|nr:universal stress protein [Bacteroidales bacterium]HOX78593.1 universal stress protein [Bacteroidales bacterium]HPI85585.1 universal stress protein [Bacteroidales bacterium]HPM92031.1 universal stress protein [Bacteroidales bacterium]
MNITSDKENIILVPTDFTPVGQNAIDHGVKACEILGFKLVILHVINRETRAVFGKTDTEKAVQQRLAEIAEAVKTKSTIEVEVAAREGSIFDVISEVAKELKVNLMILGTHGKRGLQHLMGSYAMKVITQSPVPVIVVQKRQIGPGGYRKVVFPISLHTESRQQVFYAIVTQLLFKGEIHIFKQTGNNPEDNTKLRIITSQITEEFDNKHVRYSLTEADRASNFTGQLLDFAVSESADLIMMITDSDSIHPTFDNSSWSEKLIFNIAQIPVFCINPVFLGQTYYSF